MEVLNALIHEVDRLGHLTPLPSAIAHCRVSVYADNLVILLAPAEHDLSAIRQVLELFAGASGLMTNIDKCAMTPIAFPPEDLQNALQAFPCRVEPFPTKYLGLQAFPCRVEPFPTKYLGAPLSVYRLARSKEQELIDSVAARVPTWKAHLLNHVGRATLVQSTLSAIPVHISICCSLSAWALKAIDRTRLPMGRIPISGRRPMQNCMARCYVVARVGGPRDPRPSVPQTRTAPTLGMEAQGITRSSLGTAAGAGRAQGCPHVPSFDHFHCGQRRASFILDRCLAALGAALLPGAGRLLGRAKAMAPALGPRRATRQSVGTGRGCGSHGHVHVPIHQTLDALGRRTAQPFRPRHDGRAMDSGRFLLQCISLPCLLRRPRHDARCKGTVGCPLPTQSQVLLLDCFPWPIVDSGTPQATWPPTNRQLRPLRTAR